MKRLFLYVSSFLSFALLLNQCFLAWHGDSGSFTWVLLIVSYVYLLISMSIIAFKKELRIYIESDPVKVLSYPEYYKPARLAIILLLILPLVIAGILYKKNKQDCNKIKILIANFYGDTPENYQITEEILSKIKNSLSIYPDTQILPLNKSITEQQGSNEAQKIGEAACAKLVIWGRYTVVGDDIKLTVHFENLNEKDTTLGKSLNFTSLSKLDKFQFQTLYPSQMNSLTMFVVGIAQFRAEKYEEALNCFSIALENNDFPKELDTQKSYLFFYRGNTNSILGNLTSAMKDFDSCTQIDPSFAMAYNNRGMLNQQNPLLAIKDYEKAIELDPDTVYPYVNLGVSYLQINELEKATYNISKAFQLAPDFIPVRFTKGMISDSQKDYNSAIKEFSFIIQNSEKHNTIGISQNRILAWTYTLLGDSYRGQGNRSLAFVNYNLAIKSDTSCALCYEHLATAYAEEKNYDLAISNHHKALEIEPNSAVAHYNLGQIYLDLNKVDEALKENLLAIQYNNSGLFDVYGKVGFLYYLKGDYRTSIEYLLKGIAASPNNANSYYGLGLTQYAIKEYEKSLNNFNQAIKLNPNISYFYSNRAKANNSLYKYADAIKDCESSFALNPIDPEAFLERGIAYAKLGDLNRAKNDLKRVLELTPNKGLIELALSHLHEITEKSDPAKIHSK